jgi:hypothetical protein
MILTRPMSLSLGYFSSARPSHLESTSFLGRKDNGERGAKTIWQGLREIAVFVQGVRFAGQQGTCVQ